MRAATKSRRADAHDAGRSFWIQKRFAHDARDAGPLVFSRPSDSQLMLMMLVVTCHGFPVDVHGVGILSP